MTQAVYNKGDVRRTLQVLAAIDHLGNSASTVDISKKTGLDRKTIHHQISHAVNTLGVIITKRQQFYSVTDWGPVLKIGGVRMTLRGTFPDGKLIEIS